MRTIRQRLGPGDGVVGPPVTARARVVLAALLVAAGTACRDDDAEAGGDDAAAATEQLAQVVEQSTAQPYRFELTAAVDAAGIDVDEPIATGESDGERLHVQLDANTVAVNLVTGFATDRLNLPDLGDVDRSIETIVDSDALYLRSPVLAALGDEGTLDVAERAELPPGLLDLATEVGDGWGRADRSSFDDVLPTPLQALDPARGLDAGVIQDLLDDASDVDGRGTSEIAGEEMSGLVADVSVEDLVETLALDVGVVPGLDGMLDGPPGSLEFPVELWIDADDHLRQLDLSISGDDVADRGGSWDDLARRYLGDLSLGITLDLFDYGNDEIAVDVPTDPVDVSDDVVDSLVALVVGG
jgi:hypothetical protein